MLSAAHINVRRSAIAIASLGFLLALPSLALGLHAIDDHEHRNLILEHLAGHSSRRAWYDLYQIVDGDARRALIERYWSLRPWWSLPELRVRFLRPVAVVTLYADYILWPNHPWVMHLQSAFWYGLVVFAVTTLCVRLSADPRVGLLGSVGYAVDDAHVQPIAWLAHRNLLVATLFAVLGLLLHDSAAHVPRFRTTLLSALCFALALFSAESAIAILAFVFAYAIFLDQRRAAARLGSIVPVAIVTVCWLCLHRALGYGSYGSGFYLDPVSDPSAYLRSFTERYRTLVECQFAAPSTLLSLVGVDRPWTLQFASSIEWLTLLSCGLFVIRTIDRSQELKFWCCAWLLALPPLLAAPPNDRVLTIAGIAWWMTIAHFLKALFLYAREHSTGRSLAASSLLALFALVHGIFAPAALAVGLYRFDAIQGPNQNEQAAPVLGNDPSLTTADVVVINAPDAMLAGLIPLVRISRGLRVPRHHQVLGVSVHEVEVTRIDEHAFELLTAPGYLLDPFANFWRGVDWPFHQGERVRLAGYEALIVRVTPDGRPLRVRFTFDVNLDDPQLRFIVWNRTRFELFHFEPIGHRRVIPAEFDHTRQLPEASVR